MSGGGLQLDAVSVAIDGRPVLDRVSLAAEPGEMLVLAGPSGSGKSTLLRAIAGLLPLQDGSVRIDGRRIDTLAPGKRDVAMVFQNHAVMPHMSVLENLCFGLRARGMPRRAARARATEVATSLGLGALLERLPDALSGGERQRIALGRALLREARVILMDEPLSSLDGPLRTRLRNEIVGLHQKIDTTIVYVTHDQTEALGMADHLGVLDQGRLLQLAPPREVYEEPADRFVATFLGYPPINLLLAEGGGGATLRWAGADLALTHSSRGPVQLGIRPEHVQVDGSRWARTSPTAATLRATLRRREMLGDVQVLFLDVAGESLCAQVEPDFQPAEALEVHLPRNALLGFDPDSGRRLW